MTQIAQWFERKFEFTFPIDLYPNLIMRLRGTPARLEEILRDQPREALIGKPEAKWSAQEHAGHLLDLEPLWLKRADDYITQSAQLSVADLSNRKTDEANHNAHDIKGILNDFRNARSLLVDRVNGIDPALFSRTLLHPRLKQPMRLVDHLFFVAEHDDHHLAKIWELINQRAASNLKR